MKNHAEKCATRKTPNIAAGHAIPRECDCDGYHTFDELYDHRITLYIALCRSISTLERKWGKDRLNAGMVPVPLTRIWRSKKHSDGEPAFGGTWFVLGIGMTPGKQITYHLPIERWDETDFAETLDKAPEWDGHTSDDVISRLKRL